MVNGRSASTAHLRKEKSATPRILVINPSDTAACGADIAAAIASFRWTNGPIIDLVSVTNGPSEIQSWRDWHAAAEPVCRTIEREAADCYVIACASDSGLDAARAVTPRPVLGAFRCAVAVATTRAERFGVVGFFDSSKARHEMAVRSMGLESRLAGLVSLNVSMEALCDPVAARGLLIDAAMDLMQLGATSVVLGCIGMMAYRAGVEAATRVPVIDPCQAAVAMAQLAI